MKKKINVSSSSFEGLIKNNCLYIDKTKYFYDIITSGNTYFFLSRPRRFGKTLTINTLENIFKGKKELFKDLYIGKTDYDFKEYPVIHIDFGNIYAETKDDMKEFINSAIDKVEDAYNIEHTKASYSIRMQSLLQKLSKKEKVVVLIDEYDKPISSSITQKNSDPEGVRDVLRGFFEVLKASYDYVRFVFITGVTKFAKTSIFSAMNNLFDLSFNTNYATMLGYTQEELEDNFKEYINDGVKATNLSKSAYLGKLKQKYDGYKFASDAESVYNPVSISTFFEDGGIYFNNYWAETGGNAKLIMDIAKRVDFNIDTDLKGTISKSLIASYDIVDMTGIDTDAILLKSLMLQSGYLTIVKATGYDDQELVVDFPNDEVRETFSKGLISVYIGTKAERSFSPYKIIPYFEKGDIDGAIEVIKSIYASVPNEVSKNLKESSYHLAFYCMLKSCGAAIDTEVSSSKGRADAILENANHIYIIEFKVDKSAEEALSQILDKSYYDAYNVWKKTKIVHLVGINFSSKERNITSYTSKIVK